MNLWLPVPDPQEQAVIAKHIEQQTVGNDVAIARARRQIELLREYRNRLIADVVTGKLDVRKAAAALPETDPPAEDEVDDRIHADSASNPEERDTVREANL